MNVRRALFSVIMALVLLAPFAPVRADVVLKGDRVDPCQQLHYWQNQPIASTDATPSTWILAYLQDEVLHKALVKTANACAATYDSNNDPGGACDAYIVAASADEAYVKFQKSFGLAALVIVTELGEATNGYQMALTECRLANRPKILLDAIKAARDKNRDSLASLLKKP